MSLNCEPKCIVKILLGKWFLKFWSRDFFAKRKFVFGRHFKTKHSLIVLFADICFWVYTHMVQVLCRNFYGKLLKNEWVQVDPLVNKHE